MKYYEGHVEMHYPFKLKLAHCMQSLSVEPKHPSHSGSHETQVLLLSRYSWEKHNFWLEEKFCAVVAAIRAMTDRSRVLLAEFIQKKIKNNRLFYPDNLMVNYYLRSSYLKDKKDLINDFFF